MSDHPIKPEQFDIVRRAGTQQCKLRIIVEPGQWDEEGAQTVPVKHIWMSHSRYFEPIEGEEAAAVTAVKFAADLFGEVFARGVFDHFVKRGLLKVPEGTEQPEG